MFNFTKKFMLTTSFVTLFSGQFVAYGSEKYPDDGERDSKRLKVVVSKDFKSPKKRAKTDDDHIGDNNVALQLVQAPMPSPPLFGRNPRDIELKIVNLLDGRSAINFALVCRRAYELINLRGRVKFARCEGPLSTEQVQLLHGNLKILDLLLCKIGDAGATSLAPELGKLLNLTDLRLNNNQIGDYGFGCLSMTMLFLGNTPGAVVHLQNNNITDQIRQMPHAAYFRL